MSERRHSHNQLAPETTVALGRRLAALQACFDRAGVDALLIHCENDIRYLTGFVGHDSLLLVRPQAAIIISDSRYDEFLDPWRQAGAAEVVMGVRHRLHESVRVLCSDHGIRRLGIQAEHVTIATRETLASALGAERLVPVTGLVGRLRQRKDNLEIASIERAIRIAQDAIGSTLEQIVVGMTELEFSAILEYEMKSRGSEGAGFTPIIGAGANSSIIHHQTGSSKIEPGALLVDWGATVDGYCSDLTRTFAIGDWPAKLRKVHPVVLEAQQAAIQAIAPGKTCAEIDAVARRVIVKAGYGEQFGHGLGHGLGMDVHESPYFNDLETAVRLEPGMVMTVEPGIYLPGIGGVRIEDDVLVTERGARVLSDWPRDLPSCTIDSPSSALSESLR